MVHIIKVYFSGPKQKAQIRRLAVNTEVVSRFDLLVRKIREMFPVLARGHVEVTWKDSENDVIHMSTDEELAQALANADDDILRIYAYSLDDQECEDRETHNLKNSHNEMHQNVICDGCDKTIYGYRYKCLQCRNFDLCSACNAANKHENHDMIKLVRPTHISREWVFTGARKIWKSMFGRCPSSYFTASAANQNEQATKPDPEKNNWPGILDDLLKGGFVSADKLIKDNLGNFLDFVESVSGNLDVKLESSPPKPSPCNEKQENKTDSKSNNCSSNVEPTFAAAASFPSGEFLKECLIPVISKAAEQLGNPASSGVVKEEQRENIVESCGLFHNNGTDKKSDKLLEEQNKDETVLLQQFLEKMDVSVVGDSKEKQPKESSAKPCGLFGDNESSDGWTILNKQEDEKKDVASANDKGAKPKYSSIYPSINEKVPSSEISQSNADAVNTETKLKEVAPSHSDVSKVPPKPAAAATATESVNDKFAKLKQNEDVASNYDSEIMNALVKMQAMGFTNEGGWLERLLLTKDGNINATLDALYPNTRRH